MKIEGSRILVTGASSGIGRATALELASRGARLVLMGRDRSRLDAVAGAARESGAEAATYPCDLSRTSDVATFADHAEEPFGGLDVVLNNAGANAFCRFEEQDAERLEALFRVNVLAPMLLTSRFIPRFRARGSGTIAVVGSIFGSIGFPYFSAYSATKFALRGFCEALRRELHGTGVNVVYVAPRATRTGMSDTYSDLAEGTKMKMDPPELVARRVADAIAKDRAERFLGFPERLFVRLNSWFPRLIDRSLFKEAERMEPYARLAAGGAPDASGSATVA